MSKKTEVRLCGLTVALAGITEALLKPIDFLMSLKPRKAHVSLSLVFESSPENVKKHVNRDPFIFFLNEESFIHWSLNFYARRQKG